jgi:hypothetical protein
VLTGSGVVHDLVADGTYEHGVRDVMASDFTTPAEMAARYEGGALVLRPRGLPAGESRRWRDGPDLRWDYHGFFVARLVRPAPPDG